jgi:diguanylate cyclase (GGDEF)-like protein
MVCVQRVTAGRRRPDKARQAGVNRGGVCFAGDLDRIEDGKKMDDRGFQKSLNACITAGVELSGARYGYITVVGDDLLPLAEVALAPAAPDLAGVMGRLAGWAVRAEQSVSVGDTTQSAWCREAGGDQLTAAALVCAPLRSLDGRVYGAVVLGGEPGVDAASWERAVVQLAQAGELVLETASKVTGGSDRFYDGSGAYTQEFLYELAAREASRHKRHKTSYSMLNVEVRASGMELGVLQDDVRDLLMAEIVRRMRIESRRVNSVARVGGSAFCVLIPEATRAAAGVVAQTLADAIESSPYTYVGDAGTIEVTLTAVVQVATNPSETELEAWWAGGAFPADGAQTASRKEVRAA